MNNQPFVVNEPPTIAQISQWIELTRAVDSSKVLVKLSSISSLEEVGANYAHFPKPKEGEPVASAVVTINGMMIPVVESYREIKSVLCPARIGVWQ